MSPPASASCAPPHPAARSSNVGSIRTVWPWRIEPQHSWRISPTGRTYRTTPYA
jgi:hypothetical protein